MIHILLPGYYPPATECKIKVHGKFHNFCNNPTQQQLSLTQVEVRHNYKTWPTHPTPPTQASYLGDYQR